MFNDVFGEGARAGVTLNLFDLHGKSAVVTGASEGGLGFFSAVGLAQAGAAVLVTDTPANSSALHNTAAAVEDAGGGNHAHLADISRQTDITQLVAAAEAELGQIDILVHHAGVMLRKNALETSLEEWDSVVRINLTATFLLNCAFAKPMLSRGYGKIINTSSIYTNIVGPLPETAYYATKAGIANLTRGFAAEWGKAGLTVNCIAPGVFYPTRMTAALADQPQRLAEMAGRTLLGRLGDPARDLAGTVIWLASDGADYVTGQIIFVDGGWTAN